MKRTLFAAFLLLSGAVFSQPTITGFAPDKGVAGSSVVISGTNFSTTPSENIVLFGTLRATVTAATTTSLTVTVPASAPYKPISVTINKLCAFSTKSFITTFTGPPLTNTSLPITDSRDAASAFRAIEAGDLDGDGKIDLVTVGSANDSASIRIYRNATDSNKFSLSEPVSKSTGNNPGGIAIADLNGDGKPEIITANLQGNQGMSNVSVFKNNCSPGTIDFSSKVDFATDNLGNDVQVSDIDGDGKPDIIFLSTTGIFNVLRNTTSAGGDISFATRLQFNVTGLMTGSGMTVGDLNGDGKPDVAISKFTSDSGEVNVFRNTSTIGAISFADKYTINTGTMGGQITAGYLETNGPPNLVLCNRTSGKVSVYTNNSAANISFISKIDLEAAKNPFYLRVADFDGDGKPDIAAGQGSGSVVFFRNITTGLVSFSDPLPVSTSLLTTAMTVADFDTDGKPDMAFLGMSENKLTIFRTRAEAANKPKITAINPTAAANGETVTITGSKFTSATGVTFGGMPQTWRVISDSVIRVTVAGGSSGTVIITTQFGVDSLRSFTYLTSGSSKPHLTSVNPTSGTTGDVITITGSKLSGASSVMISSAPAASYTIVSDSLIRAIVGAGSAGKAVVTTPGGVDSIAFTFIPPGGGPAKAKITAVTPLTGTTGDVITITGSSLNGVTTVSFGGTMAASSKIISDSTIRAVLGAGSSGTVVVSGSTGIDSFRSFTFLPADGSNKPKIIGITPSSATTGDVVTITGSKLGGTYSVRFGGTESASFKIVSDSLIRATVGSGSSGAVLVLAPAGSDSIKPFIFIQPVTARPHIISFTPQSATSGDTVTIRGTDIGALTSVLFGGVPATYVKSLSDTLAKAIVGKGASGSVVVTKTTGTDSLAGFTYLSVPQITLLNPAVIDLSFTAIRGNTVSPKSLFITGKFLQADVVVTAPDPFLVSKSEGTGFGSSISFTPVNGSLDSSVRVYVKFKNDVEGSFSGMLTISSANASTRTVPLSAGSCDSAILLLKPVINSFAVDSSLICMKDSVILGVTSGNYAVYKWSTNDTTKTITVKNAGTFTVQVGSMGGCLSQRSYSVRVVKNTNPVPVLALNGDTTLVSSSAPNYRWYFNNSLVSGSTGNTLVVKKVGFYSVETSNDKICWDRSNDYPIVILNTPIVNDTLSVKSYPNPATGGSFTVVATLERTTNVVARVTITDANGAVLLQTNKFIFFGREIKIPINLNASLKGTIFIKLEINGGLKTQTVILQ